VLLIIFIIVVNAIIFVHDAAYNKKHAEKKSVTGQASRTIQLDIEKKEADGRVDRLLDGNRPLRVMLTVASLIILLLLALGIVINVVFLTMRMMGKRFISPTFETPLARWGIWDVCKVAILFSFFGYMLIIIESALARTFPLIKNDNLRMVINSSILDVLAVVLIIYFTVHQYKEKLSALGLSLKNFFKNVFYGVVSYIAAVPFLLLILVVISVVSGLLNYVPKEQAVVKLFMKESDGAFLLYTIFFAAIAGPVIEEIFFRSFMYNALKKHIGIIASALITALIFSTLHAHAIGFVPIMALGLLLTYLYETTGTLTASITAHIMHNTGMVLLVMLVKHIR
jgi:hypothetical protein